MYSNRSLIFVFLDCSLALIITISCSIARDIITFNLLKSSVKSVISLSTVESIITLFSLPWNLSTVSAFIVVFLNVFCNKSA